MIANPVFQKFEWTFEKSKPDALAEVVDQIRLHAFDFEKSGIYLLTSNSGANSSVEFWKGALEQGVDFANPRNFPWTLASCPAGYFARHLNISGPNYTLIGKSNNIVDLQDLIEFDLENGLIEKALVIKLDWGFHKMEVATCQYTFVDATNYQSLIASI